MGTATGQAPLVVDIEVSYAAVAAGDDLHVSGIKAPFTGTVSAVEYVPRSTLTGADTDSRTLNLYNRGAAGAGTTLVATRAFANGTNATAYDATTITLSATASYLDVTDGDELVLQSLHVGQTGLADPGGAIRVQFTRD